jgi:hypothetical protein
VHPVRRSRGGLAGVVGRQVGVSAGCKYPDQRRVPVPAGRTTERSTGQMATSSSHGRCDGPGVLCQWCPVPECQHPDRPVRDRCTGTRVGHHLRLWRSAGHRRDGCARRPGLQRRAVAGAFTSLPVRVFHQLRLRAARHREPALERLIHPYAVFFIAMGMAMVPSVLRCLRLQIGCESCVGPDVAAEGRSGLRTVTRRQTGRWCSGRRMTSRLPERSVSGLGRRQSEELRPQEPRPLRRLDLADQLGLRRLDSRSLASGLALAEAALAAGDLDATERSTRQPRSRRHSTPGRQSTPVW